MPPNRLHFIFPKCFPEVSCFSLLPPQSPLYLYAKWYCCAVFSLHPFTERLPCLCASDSLLSLLLAKVLGTMYHYTQVTLTQINHRTTMRHLCACLAPCP